MKHYRVELTPTAQKQIKKLPPQAQRQIIKQLEKLQYTPKPHGIKKLSGMDNLYRIRVGDYRVIYTIKDEELFILVVKVGNRKEIYRHLNILS